MIRTLEMTWTTQFRRARHPECIFGIVNVRPYYWLALIPPLGMLAGIPFVNRANPHVLGLPPLLAWMIAWILITPIIMGVILMLDRRRDK
jgi:hypothetical protein